jgi:hypothetical protein
MAEVLDLFERVNSYKDTRKAEANMAEVSIL